MSYPWRERALRQVQMWKSLEKRISQGPAVSSIGWLDLLPLGGQYQIQWAVKIFLIALE
jgi:hypothetical protein